MIRPARVLFLSGHLAPHVGGVERFVKEISTRLVEAGYEVGAWSSNTDDSSAEELNSGVKIRRFDVIKVIEDRYPIPVPNLLLLKQFKSWLRWQPDLVITNTRFFLSSALGLLLARSARCPVLHIEHGSSSLEFQMTALNLAGRMVDATLGRIVLRRSTIVAGVSGASARFAERLGGETAIVIPNGINSSEFILPTDKPALSLPANSRYVLFVGRLLREKGALLLAKAFEQAALGEEWHLVVAGDGPELRELPRQPRMHLLGQVSQLEVRRLLSQAAIFCHPSWYPEGLPTSLLEASASGVPSIATDAGGSAEVVIDGHTGIIVEKRSLSALVMALRKLAKDEGLRNSFGKNARTHVSENFDWDRICKRLSITIQSLIKSEA